MPSHGKQIIIATLTQDQRVDAPEVIPATPNTTHSAADRSGYTCVPDLVNGEAQKRAVITHVALETPTSNRLTANHKVAAAVSPAIIAREPFANCHPPSFMGAAKRIGSNGS